jgi:plasmid stabilization system protein ParE
VPNRVLLTDRAEADVAAVLRWFRDQRATAAGGRWLAQLTTRLDTLEQHPERCPLAPESEDIGEPVRELLFGRGRFRYRILFVVSRPTVFVVRIWHSSRDAPGRSDLTD